MFTIELISLLNEVKKNPQNTNSLKSIIKLIDENSNEYEKFKNSPEYNLEVKNIINTANEFTEKNEKINDTDGDDISKIQTIYFQWFTEYNKNQKITSPNSELITSVIKFYIPNRYDIITKILDLNIDDNYNLFRNHLKNKLRSFFAKQIVEYTKKEQYNNLNFFKKYKKRKELYSLMNKINKYEFDFHSITEVLK